MCKVRLVGSFSARQIHKSHEGVGGLLPKMFKLA